MIAHAWEGRERDHAGELARHQDGPVECGGCARVGKPHRAEQEGRVCECGSVLCRACWDESPLCRDCQRRAESVGGAE